MDIKTAKERLWKQIVEQKEKGQLLEVVGVGIGKEEIAVLVEKKTLEFENKIKALDSGGYRVKIVVIGKIRLVYGKGDTIYNKKIGRGGTVAIPVYRKSDDALMLLSCNHVLCMNTNRTTRSVKGDTITDKGGKAIATLEAWEPIKVTCWMEGGVQKCDYFVKNYIDAAIAKPLNPAEITGISEIFSAENPEVGREVTFHGGISGEKTGAILYTDMSYGLTLEDEVYNFFDCFLMKAKCEGGDSGSIVTTSDGKTAVGMLQGSTSEDYAMGCPINKVLNTLGLNIMKQMAEKACVYFESIPRDQEVIVGDSKRLVLQIQNCGDADGLFYSEIMKDGVRCASEHNKSISVGRLGSLLECALFDMPNRVVTVDYRGGHAEAGVWKEDFRDTVKLTPKVVTEKCTQWFKVKDNLGNVIAGARIKIENDKTEYKNTASNGRISFELTVGIRYTATASKSGYDCLRCSNNFEAPYGGEITLTLKKKEVAPLDCLINADCPSGYVCKAGKCVKEVACSDWTTKSTCESHGCFWFDNSCHEYGPVKCSDYTDALTCAANNCYWWSDGTCHDTEEVAPVATYEECGRVPTSADSKTYITNWWKCVCGVAVKKGVCSSKYYWWFSEVNTDAKAELGVTYIEALQTRARADGDSVKIWMGVDPETYLGRFKWVCPPVAGKFIINVPKGIFGPIDKGVVMVYKVHKLPFIDAYVSLGLPAKSLWCVTLPRTFELTTADLEIGSKYAIFPSSSVSVLPYVTSKCVYEFTDKVQTIDLPVYIDPLNTMLCGFFDLTPSECAVFLLEFVDPIYAANTLSVIQHHEDIMGNPREPETLDYIMLPIVMVGSLLPMVPAGKISQWTGRGLKLAKKSVASKTFLIRHHRKIHHLIAVGDETRILKFKAFFDLGNLGEALKILDGGVVASEATEAAKALKRANLRNWVRGIRAKWRAKKPKTPLEKMMDDALEHNGNVFKTQADVVVKHVDEAKGDWTKIRKIWDDTVKTADDVVYVDLHLAGKSDDVQVIHNMMRYSKDDFVKAFKAEGAINPKFANRFDEGVDFMLRHIGDETGTEVAKYRKAIKGLSDTDINNIVKNLDVAGQGNLARIIKTLKVAPEGGMKFFDDAADALKGVKKLSAKERKALGGILDTGFDDAAKHLDEKWKVIFRKIMDTEDSVKNPQGRRFWNYIRGHGKTKDMMAKYGVTTFRGLPFFGKVAAFTGIFFIFYGSFKIMMDMCMALFMGEETIQWGGFGGIVLNNLLRDFKKKPLTERKEIIKVFEDFAAKRHAIHDGVTKGSPLFEKLCVIFGDVYRRFWEADAVNLWALDTTIEYLKKDINPFTGIGECTIRARADKDGVDFWYQGSPTKWHGGRAFSWTEIKQIPVRATPEEVTVCAWKAGYLMDTHIIKIFPEDVGATKEMELFELIPESSVSGTPNPFGYQSPPDTTNLPTPIGNANPGEYFGDVIYGSIRCESIPTGAGVYLDVKDSAHYKGKTGITLAHIPVGVHKIIQTFPNFNDCVVNVNVVVEPMVYAYCRFPTPTCSFTPSTTTPKLNEVVTFDASASSPGTGAASLTYDWDWGDGKPHGTRKIETHAYVAKGVYAVKLTVTNEMGGSKVCTTNITVEVAVGNIKCYCEAAEYCGRNADIFVDGKKVDVTKESGYTYIKNLTPGVHTVKYNLLDVMECSGSVTVTADVDVDFKCQLKSKLPASQTAKVTAIVDGDGIKTDKTGTHEIRIIGYDAFECRIYPSDCTLMGKYGYEKLKSLIPVGTSVTLKIDQWLPLGAYNRVIADIFVGTKDIAAEMLKSCLVRFPAKTYRDKYYWDPWAEYERIWCDPAKVIPPDEYKPKIVEIETAKKSFKIKNNWLALWFLPEFVDSGGTLLGKATERKIEVGKTSTAITYFASTYAIKLYARVDTKDDWTLVDTGYVAVAPPPPTKKTVTFKSIPSGASVTVVKKESARLVRALKRVRSERVINI